MKYLHEMSEADMLAADDLKNSVVDFVYKSGKSKLVMFSAVQCVAKGLRDLIEEQAGCEIEEVRP